MRSFAARRFDTRMACARPSSPARGPCAGARRAPFLPRRALPPSPAPPPPPLFLRAVPMCAAWGRGRPDAARPRSRRARRSCATFCHARPDAPVGRPVGLSSLPRRFAERGFARPPAVGSLPGAARPGAVQQAAAFVFGPSPLPLLWGAVVFGWRGMPVRARCGRRHWGCWVPVPLARFFRCAAESSRALCLNLLVLGFSAIASPPRSAWLALPRSPHSPMECKPILLDRQRQQ